MPPLAPGIGTNAPIKQIQADAVIVSAIFRLVKSPILNKTNKGIKDKD